MKQIVKVVFLSSVLTGLSAYAQDTQNTLQIATRANTSINHFGDGAGGRGGAMNGVRMDIFRGRMEINAQSSANQTTIADTTLKIQDADSDRKQKQIKEKVEKNTHQEKNIVERFFKFFHR